MHHTRRHSPIWIFGFLLVLLPSSGWALRDEASARIKGLVDEASRYYKEKDYELAGNRIEEALAQLSKLADKGASESDMEILKQAIPRLKKAREVLAKQGVLISDMVELTSDGKRKGGSGSSERTVSKTKPKVSKEISFSKQVAPILLRNCGGCHVQGSRGQLNFASYRSLTDSTSQLFVAGSVENSEAYQMVESGKMPPKGSVPDSDIKILKKWIEEGAKFDGDDASASMDTYARR